MIERINEPAPPSGFGKAFYRFPLVVYRLGLGSIMGGRFIYLIHTGRVSGQRREVVLEVVDHEPTDDRYFVVAAWGERADWYRNILKTPAVEAQVGRHKFIGQANPIPEAEAEGVFLRYGRRHPRALKAFARIMGYRIEMRDEAYQALGREIPVVSIQVESELR
jgi:deazaflavin-dependent oxidoreductase (nitroreductase family)